MRRSLHVPVIPLNSKPNTGYDRMKALGAAAAGLNIANNAKDIAAAADALKSGNLAGAASVNVSIGSSRSHSLQTTQSDADKASSLSAGGDVNLSARGAGADANILVQGSDINAGGNATLQADKAVTLQAAQDRFSEQSSQSSSGASLGVSYGAGGWGVSASANRSGGNGNGDATTQQNTHVSAGNTLTIQSGGDTSLNGAVAQAERVVADVGGNLNISSQQDTATYRAKSASSGGSLAFGGGQAGGSISGGKTAINSDYASVNETSALRAGDEGFDVQVKGDTTLSGGQITSTEAAVQSGANRFETDGQVAMVDVNNTSEYKADGASISIGAGSLKGASAGIGSDSGSAASVTTSGISGIAGNTAVRTGDAESGIANTFDKTRVQNEVDAQVQITAAFGQQASRAAGTYANGQAKSLRQQAIEADDPTLKAALNDQASKWDEGGEFRTAMHAVIGGLSGGAAGAVGSGVASAAAPALNDLQSQFAQGLQDAGLSATASQTLAALAGSATAATIGSAASGGSTAGAATALNADANNRQLHPSEIILANELAQKSKGKYTVEEIQDALRNSGNKDLNETVATGMVTDVTAANAGVYDGEAKFDAGSGAKNLVQILPNGGAVDPELAAFIQTNTGGTDSAYGWNNVQLGKVEPPPPLNPNTNIIANDRDPMTGLQLDNQGRYKKSVQIEGVTYQPKFFACGSPECQASGANLDLNDPNTRAYVRAMSVKAASDIGTTASLIALINPVGAASVTAQTLSIAADLSRIALDKSAKEVAINQTIQYGTESYLKYVATLPAKQAQRVIAAIDLLGGWQAFSKAAAEAKF